MLSAVLIIAYFPIMVGDVDADGTPVFGAVSWFLLALIVIFPVIGYAQAAWIKKRRPAAYAKLTDSHRRLTHGDPTPHPRTEGAP